LGLSSLRLCRLFMDSLCLFGDHQRDFIETARVRS